MRSKYCPSVASTRSSQKTMFLRSFRVSWFRYSLSFSRSYNNSIKSPSMISIPGNPMRSQRLVVFALLTFSLDSLSVKSLSRIPLRFVGKFTQFTSLFVAQHLRRVEKNPNFPIINFLALLYEFTFLQPSFDGFSSCLEIWSTFLDYIIQEKMESSNSSLFVQ